MITYILTNVTANTQIGEKHLPNVGEGVMPLQMEDEMDRTHSGRVKSKSTAATPDDSRLWFFGKKVAEHLSTRSSSFSQYKISIFMMLTNVLS